MAEATKGYVDELDVDEILAAKREVGQAGSAYTPDASNSTIPDAWEGAEFEQLEPRIGDTIEETIENLRPFVEDGEDDDALNKVIHASFVGPHRLGAQKTAKGDGRGSTSIEDAQDVLNAYRTPVPGTRRGRGTSGMTKAQLADRAGKQASELREMEQMLRDQGLDDLADEKVAQWKEEGLL